MPLPVLTIAKAVWLLVPLARGLIEALGKDSDAGRRITLAELEAIVTKHGPETVKRINGRGKRRKR
jgi:hypothetical protein